MSAHDSDRNKAFETLYVDHHRWLAAWVRHRMGGEDVALDLTQEVFLRVLTSDTLATVREPRPFLATVAKRLMANHYRRMSIERAYAEVVASLPEAQVPDPENRALALEALVLIDRGLATLPAKVREAFLLAQLQGLPYREIAVRLGVSTRTITDYMLRATQQCYFSLPA